MNYCDYYGSVGATGYQTYHGCVTALIDPPIDPGDINNTCSIEPSTHQVARIDQGATWWCDYSWNISGNVIDLTDYEARASFYYPDGSLFTTVTDAPKDDNQTQFRLRLTDELTDTIEFNGECVELSVDIDLERVNTNDMITGYIVGDVVRVSAGMVKAYRRGAGAETADCRLWRS